MSGIIAETKLCVFIQSNAHVLDTYSYILNLKIKTFEVGTSKICSREERAP